MKSPAGQVIHALPICGIHAHYVDGNGKLKSSYTGKRTQCESPGYTKYKVGEVPENLTRGPPHNCGKVKSHRPPSAEDVTKMSEVCGVELEYDPNCYLDSDEPEYQGGHFRIASVRRLN